MSHICERCGKPCDGRPELGSEPWLRDYVTACDPCLARLRAFFDAWLARMDPSPFMGPIEEPTA